MRAVRDDARLSKNALAVAMAVGLRADLVHAHCTPGRGTLAADFRLSLSSVSRALNELEAAGYVVRLARFSGQRQTSNGYRLTLPEPVDNWGGGVPEPVDNWGGGVSGRHPGGVRVTPSGGVRVTPKGLGSMKGVSAAGGPVDNPAVGELLSALGRGTRIPSGDSRRPSA